MAVSKKRNKNVYTPPRGAGKTSENPKWLVPTMASLMIAGVVWILIYYVTGAQYPLPIRNWNIGVGFVMIISGFMLTTRWK